MKLMLSLLAGAAIMIGLLILMFPSLGQIIYICLGCLLNECVFG